MPTSAPRGCAHSGCAQLVHGRVNRCPQHKRTEVDRVHDRAVGSAQERGYDNRWDVARRAYLQRHPLCECPECDNGRKRVTPATVVDHIVPHRLGQARKSGNPDAIRAAQSLFWDRKNWQAMAKPCHDRKTGSGR